MPFEFIRYEKRDGVACVTINRPERLNALHPPASAEMRQAFEDFRDDDHVRVAIVSGEGERSFCAGNDLKYHVEHIKPGEAWPDAANTPFAGITDKFTCWKPIIAAVNGYAFGGGLELVLACDLAVAADHAQFSAPEGRVGLVAAAGGVHRLPRQVPVKVALRMLLTSKPIAATEALQWGIVNEVVPHQDLMATAGRLAAEVIECAPLSVTASKQMAMEGLGVPLEQAMRATYSEFDKALASPDMLEGPRAFAEKRPPVWNGSGN